MRSDLCLRILGPVAQKTNQTAQCAWRLGDPRQNGSYVELRGRSNSRLSEAAPGGREGARRNGTETLCAARFDPSVDDLTT